LSTTLNASLKRLVWMLVSGVAVLMVIVAALPETTEAQQAYGDSTQADRNTIGNIDTTAEPRVVESGDSLWSITQERLGQGASPQQIRNEVGRTLELNRDLLGDEPDRILPGQELSLPSISGTSATMPEAMPAATPALPLALSEPAPEPILEPIAESGPTAAVTEEESVAGESSMTKAPEEQTAEEEPAAEQEGIEQQPDEPSLLPETSPTEEDASVASVEELLRKPQDASRRQLGLGIIMLTFLVALLMAWNLPMRRDVGGWEEERIHLGQANDHFSYRGFGGREETQWTALFGRPDPDQPLHGSRGEALAKQNDIDRSGLIVAAVGSRRKQVLRTRAAGKRRLLRKRHAANAYNPYIRSCLRRAVGTVELNNGRKAPLRTPLRAPQRASGGRNRG
jgi:hypothetical protein